MKYKALIHLSIIFVGFSSYSMETTQSDVTIDSISEEQIREVMRMEELSKKLIESIQHRGILCIDSEYIKELVESGASVHFRTPNAKLTPLMLAAMSNDLPVVKLLLEKGARARDIDFIFFRTALVWAAEEGYLEIVQELLKHDSLDELKAQDALMRAAEMGHVTIVEELMKAFEQKVNKETSSYIAGRAFLSALSKDKGHVVKKLQELGYKKSGFYYLSVER
jgi:hypothetical protein